MIKSSKCSQSVQGIRFCLLLFIISILVLTVVAGVMAAEDDENASDSKNAKKSNSLTAQYKEAQKDFLVLKKKIQACEEEGETCKKEQKAILEPAKRFTSLGIQLMLQKLRKAKEDESLSADIKLQLLDAITTLNDLEKKIQQAEEKEEIIEVAVEVREAWSAVQGIVQEQFFTSLKLNLDDTLQKSLTIANLAECGLTKLKKSGTETLVVEKELDLFIAKVNEAKDELNALSTRQEDQDPAERAEALAAVKESLKAGKGTLTSFLAKLKSKKGKLCSPEEVEEIEDEGTFSATEEDAEGAEEQETETVDTEEFEELLKEKGIYTDYTDALAVVEEAEEFIDKQEDEDYNVFNARNKIKEARSYLTGLPLKIKSGQIGGSISAIFNAKRLAGEARTTRMTLIPTANEEDEEATEGDEEEAENNSNEPSEDQLAFNQCMTQATNSYQRTICYRDYDAEDKRTEIEDCLLESEETDEECYELADI